MSALPYMPLFVGDYISETMHLGMEEHGCYLMLLMLMWKTGGSLPDDDRMIAHMLRVHTNKWMSLKPRVLSFFEMRDGSICHSRLTALRMKALAMTANPNTPQIPPENTPQIPHPNPGGICQAKPLKYLEPASPIQISKPEEGKKERRAPSFNRPFTDDPRGSRLSRHWQPRQSELDGAAALGLAQGDIAHEVAQFRDYWAARAGPEARRVDWHGTFRTWIRNAARRKSERQKSERMRQRHGTRQDTSRRNQADDFRAAFAAQDAVLAARKSSGAAADDTGGSGAPLPEA